MIRKGVIGWTSTSRPFEFFTAEVESILSSSLKIDSLDAEMVRHGLFFKSGVGRNVLGPRGGQVGRVLWSRASRTRVPAPR